jgi:TonB family protein
MKRLFLAGLLAAGFHGVLLSSGVGWFPRTPPPPEGKKTVVLSLTYLPPSPQPQETRHDIRPKPIKKQPVRQKKVAVKKKKPQQTALVSKPRSINTKASKPVRKSSISHFEPARTKPVPSPSPAPESKKSISSEKAMVEDAVIQKAADMPPARVDQEEPVREEDIADAIAELPSPGVEIESEKVQVTGDPTKKGTVRRQMARPRYRKNPQPVYPRVAKRRGYQGMVLLEVLVGRNGSPEKVRVFRSSGHRSLDRAAVAAVKKWSFVPGREGEKRVDMWVRIPIRFQLD